MAIQRRFTSDQIRSFFGDLLRNRLPGNCRLSRGLSVDLRLDSVSLENWRDICEGRIEELILDEDEAYETEKVGHFGYLMGTTKPERLRFIEFADRFPDKFEFINTEKYSKDMQSYLSLLEYKRKFKYIIDLPGHTYSTKSYWMLFLKRPLFYVEPNLKFRWEQRLRPWVHYIPVQRDFSDLLRRYEWAESHSDKVRQMVANLHDFGLRNLALARCSTSSSTMRPNAWRTAAREEVIDETQYAAECGQNIGSHPVSSGVIRKKYLFLLSHMRSYSSVLAHMLGSHLSISGHGERLRSYRNYGDLLKTRYAEYRTGHDGSYAYLLDKVLHNQYAISNSIISRRDVKIIVFVREPAATIQSIIRMGRELLHDDNYCDPRSQHGILQTAFGTARHLLSSGGNACLYFDAEAIVNSTEPLLGVISNWLELSTPLTSEYWVFADTGQNLRGDTSNNLQQGRIVRQPAKTGVDLELPDRELPAHILTSANREYHRCRDELQGLCQTI